MTPPAIFIRIDQISDKTRFRFDAQICVGEEEKGDMTKLTSPTFEEHDEHDTFCELMKKVTVVLLKYRGFEKLATEKDIHLLNQQSQEDKETKRIVLP